jgi:hypothetical protein
MKLVIMSVPANQTKHEKTWMNMKAIWILITMATPRESTNSTLTCDIQCQSLLPTNLQACLPQIQPQRDLTCCRYINGLVFAKLGFHLFYVEIHIQMLYPSSTIQPRFSHVQFSKPMTILKNHH